MIDFNEILEEIQVKKLSEPKIVALNTLRKIQVVQPSEFGVPFCIKYILI